MPSIPLEVRECAIYLYASEEAAEEGTQAGGSGFLVIIPVAEHEEEGATFYAVTNVHVVANGFTCVRLNTLDGGHDSVALRAEDWVHHPEGDDLAIAELDLPREFRELRIKAILPDSFVEGGDPTIFGVGQDVYMIGRYVSHEGRQQNLPTARFGNIAQLPYEPVQTVSGLAQQAFLVDMRSLAGYSGAPVFVYRSRPDLNTNPDSWVTGFEQRLLGIDSGHLPALGRVLKEDKGAAVEPALWAEQNSGMATVIPAWRLTELLFDEDVVRKREEGEQAWLNARGDGPAVS